MTIDSPPSASHSPTPLFGGTRSGAPGRAFGGLPPKMLLKVGLTVFTIVLLIAINWSDRGHRSATEKNFEAWLEPAESRLQAPVSSPQPSPVSMTLEVKSAGIQWKLDSTPELREQVLRLLRLARESNLFSIGNNAPDARITVTVKEGDSEFFARFSETDIANNLPAQNFLKLFQVYALQPPPPPSKAARPKKLK
jgi:hypothetical protein